MKGQSKAGKFVVKGLNRKRAIVYRKVIHKTFEITTLKGRMQKLCLDKD